MLACLIDRWIDFSLYIGSEFNTVALSTASRLSLGDVTLDVAMGTPSGFLQQVVSMRLGQEVPEMVELGQLSHRLVCTPDLETLLNR